MSKRLIEVANELNVSTKIIVEHLRHNGFEEVNDKPTSKLSAGMYDQLVKHFRNAIAIKEQADQLSNTSGLKKKEERNSSKDKLRPWERPMLVNKEPKSLIKDSTSTTDSTTDEQKNVSKTPVAETNTENISEKIAANETPPVDTNQQQENTPSEGHTLPGPKILGKVNLDTLNNRNNNSRKDNTRKDNTRSDNNRNDNSRKDNTRKDNSRNDSNRNDNNRNDNTRNNDNKKANTGNNQETKKLLYTPKANNNKSSEQPTKDKEEQLPINSQNQPLPETNETANPQNVDATDDNADIDNSFRAETPQLQGLKILGKINLERPKSNNSNASNNNSNSNSNNNRRQRQPYNGGNSNRNDNNRNDRNRANQNTSNSTNNNSNSTNNSSNNTTNNSNTPLLHTPAVRPNVTYIKATHKQNPPANAVKVIDDGSDDKNKAPRRRIKDANGKMITVVDNKTAAKSPAKSNDRRKKGVSGDAVKATMARVQSGQKRKKIGTSRAERAEKKEQTRLRSEEHIEEAPLQVTEFISVSELAGLMDVSSTDIITTCMSLGIFVSINQRLDADVIELVASEYEYEVEFISAEEQMDIEEEEEADAPEDLVPRAPIVTVMGHVDHGKTSLLDYIRKANVVSGEAGGITQHIGAYEVAVPGKGKITFLDTPGHEAFTAMRARGAKVTDIAVIIVAADDSVMPQTKEAISHAQAANVPIIFAINKIDKEGANPERIKQELGSMNYLIEEWGGKYQSQEISAKQGLNVDLLLEKILLEAEMLELKGNPKRKAVGAVLEASLEKGRGYVAKILVQSGTLKIGAPITAGQFSGKVKAMFNERGKNVKSAGPSSPVLVLGLDGAPQAGEKIKVMSSDREAKELAAKRAQIARQQQIRATKRITLDEISRRLKIGNFRQLNLIVKADMDGSMEALSDSLIKLSTDQVQTCIVHKAVGPITESDVNLALASDAIIVGFQVRPNTSAKKLAEQEGVQIKTYSIIYDAINEVKAALEGLLQPKQVEKEVGMVEIREVFKITKVGTVAGCYVTEGKIFRNSHIRVIRDGIVIYPTKENTQGELSSLKRFKDSMSEVKAGFECGITIKNFDSINVGDMIEAYEIIEVKQRLDDLKLAKV